jgi:hypothetical protein
MGSWARPAKHRQATWAFGFYGLLSDQRGGILLASDLEAGKRRTMLKSQVRQEMPKPDPARRNHKYGVAQAVHRESFDQGCDSHRQRFKNSRGSAQ